MSERIVGTVNGSMEPKVMVSSPAKVERTSSSTSLLFRLMVTATWKKVRRSNLQSKKDPKAFRQATWS